MLARGAAAPQDIQVLAGEGEPCSPTHTCVETSSCLFVLSITGTLSAPNALKETHLRVLY
jgi:hypothetical protein